MNSLDNITVSGKVTHSTAATAANDLLRLVEAQALLAALWQGTYSAGTPYTAGQMVTSGGALYLARINNTGGYTPSTNPTQWAVLVPAQVDGAGQICLYTTTDPTTDHITPADISKPAFAYKLGGITKLWGWNNVTHAWE